ncbi:MAG: hypothetical protein WC836_12605 [Desulfobacula sp.]|jgi:hypothetical protein
MSWQYVLELIQNILSFRIGIPHLTVGHVVMLLIGMLLSRITHKSIDAKKETADPKPLEGPSASVRIQDTLETEMPVAVKALPPGVASAIGLALHLFTNGGRNLRLSDTGMKAAAIGLALHLHNNDSCPSDMGSKAAAIGLAMHLQKTSGAEI